MGISVSALKRSGGSTVQAIDNAKYSLGLEQFNSGGLRWLGYSGTLPDSRWIWGYSSATQSGRVIMVSGVSGANGANGANGATAAKAATLAALTSALAEHLRRDAVLLTQR